MDQRIELVGLSEIAKHAGVVVSAVSNWANYYGDFPEPVAKLHCGRIWNWADVEAWLERTGRRTDARWTIKQVHKSNIERRNRERGVA